MTTNIVKAYNPSGSGADTFTTEASLMAWIRSLDPVGTDSNYQLLLFQTPTWAQDTSPISSSDTQRLKIYPALGQGVNDLNKSAFNTTSGIGVVLPRAQYDLQISSGVDFINLNIIIGETGQAAAVKFKDNRPGNTYDNQFIYCRILDQTTSNGQSFSIGNNSSRFRMADCLVVIEKPSDYLIRSTSGGNLFERNTVVGRNSGVGTTALLISSYGGDTIIDSVFINTGVHAAQNGGSNTVTNNFANNGSTGGGVTVVTGTGVLVVNESNDFTPAANSALIGAATSSANGTLDIIGGNRGPAPDIGARQRTAYAPLPTATITNTAVTTTSGNKRRVTISGTTTGSPTSGLGTITPTSRSGNNGVAQSNIALTFPTSSTFQVVFSDDTRVGEYSETVTVSNSGGTGSATGGTIFNVTGATGTITNQTFDGQVVTLSGTTTGTPTSGAITWPADTTNTSINTTTQGPFALTLGSGTFSDTNRVLPAGQYLKPVATFTMAAGTSFPADGVGAAITIMPIGGNPEIPPATTTPPASTVSSVTVSPNGATIQGGATQQFTATVVGTNTPSQTVTWSKTSGVGSISTTGLVTAPAATTSSQTGVFRATSIQDNTKYADFTVTVPAASGTVTGVVVSPSTANVGGGATQQFTAAVQGTNNPAQSVTWTATAGAVNSSGAFTAPAATNSVQTVTVTATSTFDTSKSGTATVTVAALSTPVVSAVLVAPATATVIGGESQAFSASVTGQNSPPTGVTWSASAGSISSIGIFTAPAAGPSAQTVTVTATSTFDGTKSGTATVTVPAMALPTITSVLVSPAVAAMIGGGTRQFAAQVLGTGSPSQSVTWSASIGSISTTGLYTAPVATLEIAAAVITATSVYDQTKYGTASAIIAAIDVDPTIQQAYLLNVAANGWLSGNYFDTRGRRARIDKVVGERQVYGIDLNEWLTARGTSVLSATLKAEGVTVDSRAYILNGVVMCWVKGGKADDFECDNPALNYLTIHYKCTNGTENEYTIWFDVLPL